jgi:hypothetical protein
VEDLKVCFFDKEPLQKIYFTLHLTMNISAGTVVTFNYIMYDDRGAVLQDNTHDAPVLYLHGSNSVSAMLQQQMHGLESGSEARLSLRDQTGNYIFSIFIQSVRKATDAELVLGYPVQNDADCDPDCECFNGLR